METSRNRGSKSVTEVPFDRVVKALEHQYRRHLLDALLSHNPQDDDDPQDAEQALGAAGDVDEDADVVEIQLFHTHLPKLESMGYIDWDRAEGEIRKGPKWDEIEPILTLLRDHEDDLPPGWL